MDTSELAAQNFDQGYSCSQSVLRAFAEGLGLNADMAVRLAAAFGGGMGRTGRTCGAVSGALMALGLRYASADPADKDAKERMYTLARHLLAEFALRNGSTDCRFLIGCDTSTPDGLQQARESGVFKIQCPGYVRSAAEIAEGMLKRTAE